MRKFTHHTYGVYTIHPLAKEKNVVYFFLQYILLFCVLLLNTITFAADTVYVNDEQVINMRAGIGSQFRIVKLLKTGTTLTLLETHKEGYSKVKTQSGKIGWVLTRFLTHQPVARVRLQQIEQQLQKMNAENQKLKDFLQQLSSEKLSLSENQQNLNSSNNSLQNKLQTLRNTCSRSVELSKENDILRKTLLTHENKMTLLKQQYQLLQDNHDQNWFLIGAGVLLGGFIIGFIAPRLRIQKKSSWSSL